MMIKFLTSWGVNGFLLSVWLFVCLASYWAFLDNTPAFISNSLTISDIVVKQGQPVTIRYQTDWLRICSVSNTRYLYNLQTRLYYPIQVYVYQIDKSMVGKTTPYTVEFMVPDEIPVGRYEFVSKTTYSCNPVQKIFPVTYEGKHIPLTVLRKD